MTDRPGTPQSDAELRRPERPASRDQPSPPSRWPQGADQIEALIKAGHLERIPPSADLSERRLLEAEGALDIARTAVARSPRTAYVNAYDAARLAMAAVLDPQGLRATSKGGHIALQDAIESQTRAAGRKIIREFSEMRRIRNQAEYARADTPEVTAEEAAAACEMAAGILAMMRKFAPMVGPF